MAEGKTNMFGKTYNTVGSTDSNFIIKTKGDLKVQWGNKFIDIIKNGKIASDNNFLKIINSEEDIKQTGIYLIPETEEVWVNIDGNKINLTNTSENTYISFLEQQQLKEENKLTVLRNIGFYYKTLEEAQQANLSTGIIYVENSQNLFLVKNGELVEYATNSDTTESKNVDLSKLYIQEYSLYVDTVEYIRCDNSQVLVRQPLVLEDGLQSEGATQDSGYRLYTSAGKSYLDIDYLTVRYPEEPKDWEQYPLFTPKNNIIESSEIVTNGVSCVLIEPNTYEVGEYIYILLELNLIIEEDSKVLTITLSRTSSQDTILYITHGGVTEELIIPAGELETQYTVSGNYTITYDNIKEFKEYKIVEVDKQTIMVEVPKSEQGEFMNSGRYIYLSKSMHIHIKDNNLNVLDRSINVKDKETQEFIPDETKHTIIGEIVVDEIESLTQCPIEEEQVNSQKKYEDAIKVGIYSDNFIGLNSKLYNPVFKKRCKDQYPEYDKELTIPEHEEDHKVLINDKYNKTVPNIEWIKWMFDLYIPIGTIIMYNGQNDIPPGWAICNGQNGTPDLRNRFIKSSEEYVGENNPDGVEFNDSNINTIKIKENNLPEHNHPHDEHTHSITDIIGDVHNSGNLTTSLKQTNYLYNLQKSSVDVISSIESEEITTTSTSVISSVTADTQGGETTGANHDHSITITGGEIQPAESKEKEKEWKNDSLIIEPKSYSLLFIMKIKNFVEYSIEE